MPKFRVGEYRVIESDYPFRYVWTSGKAEINENGSQWGNTFNGWTVIFMPGHPELWNFLDKNKPKDGVIIEQIGNEFKILNNA